MQVRHSYRRTYLCCLSGRKSMSSLLQVLREQAEADRSCHRTYLCCLSGRKHMSNLLRELLQVLLSDQRRNLSEADPG